MQFLLFFGATFAMRKLGFNKTAPSIYLFIFFIFTVKNVLKLFKMVLIKKCFKKFGLGAIFTDKFASKFPKNGSNTLNWTLHFEIFIRYKYYFLVKCTPEIYSLKKNFTNIIALPNVV